MSRTFFKIRGTGSKYDDKANVYNLYTVPQRPGTEMGHGTAIGGTPNVQAQPNFGIIICLTRYER